MGQSATLYRIAQFKFDELLNNPATFNVRMTQGHTTFEQNFEGLLFLLSKLASNSEQALVQEIFYPNDSIGKTVDFDSDNFMDFSDNEPINYLSPEKVRSIHGFLGRINKRDVLALYDPDELNKNGIYPRVWHSDESPDQGFNKRHIEEGFDNLIMLFNAAVSNNETILAFVG